jgi:hypothetical protein
MASASLFLCRHPAMEQPALRSVNATAGAPALSDCRDRQRPCSELSPNVGQSDNLQDLGSAPNAFVARAQIDSS